MWAKVNKRVEIKYEKQKKRKLSSSSSSNNQDQEQQQNISFKKESQNQYSSSSQESENDSHSDQENYKNNYRRQNFQNQSSSQQQQQQQDQSYEREKKPVNKKLQSLKEESNQEEQSIDYIEERIRKLQRDLQDRLDKHKTKVKPNFAADSHTSNIQNPKQSISSKNQQDSGKIVSIKRQPPIPPKNNHQTQQNGSSLPQTQLNFKPKQKNRNIQQNQFEQYQSSNLNRNKQAKQNNSELGNLGKKNCYSKLSSPIKASKRKTNKQLPKNNKIQIQPYLSKNNKISDDFKRLSSQIGQLKKQNKNLKQQLKYYKKKKRPAQQIQKLRQLSEHDTKKLQKQFQLLKVLQRLQSKLKNSIQRKLGKGSAQNKQIKQAALLHKGLPSNILS